jgi:hypothetical protein
MNEVRWNLPLAISLRDINGFQTTRFRRGDGSPAAVDGESERVASE